MCLSVSILSVGGEPSSKYSILFINSLFAQNTLFFPIPFLFFLYNLLWILIITYQLIYLLIFVSIYLRIGHPHRLLFVLFEISIYVFLLLFYYFWKVSFFPFLCCGSLLVFLSFYLSQLHLVFSHIGSSALVPCFLFFITNFPINLFHTYIEP